MAGELIQRGPFLLQFANAQRLGNLLSRALANAPLTPDEFAVYSLLFAAGSTTPTRLAADLGMPPSTMSHYLRRMQARGHLLRAPNPADGRSSVIDLTARGRAATEACFAGFGAAITEFRRQLTIPEKELLTALEAMNRALDAAGEALLEPRSGQHDPPTPSRRGAGTEGARGRQPGARRRPSTGQPR